MTYYPDLSPYSYRQGQIPGALNVGWLTAGAFFQTEMPREPDLALLWHFCLVKINLMRGLHNCEFCPHWSFDNFKEERNGTKLMLGHSEIRVIARSGQSYAAPSLIYHYVKDHHYKPPADFIEALRTGPRPPSEVYFEALRTRGIEWELPR